MRTTDFLKFNCDCYFINDPLRNLEEYNKLVLKIIEKNEQSNKIVYFILINIGKDKHKIFDKYRLLENLIINDRGYSIYSNENK